MTHTAVCSSNSFALGLWVVGIRRMDLTADCRAPMALGTCHKGWSLAAALDCCRDCS